MPRPPGSEASSPAHPEGLGRPHARGEAVLVEAVSLPRAAEGGRARAVEQWQLGLRGETLERHLRVGVANHLDHLLRRYLVGPVERDAIRLFPVELLEPVEEIRHRRTARVHAASWRLVVPCGARAPAARGEVLVVVQHRLLLRGGEGGGGGGRTPPSKRRASPSSVRTSPPPPVRVSARTGAPTWSRPPTRSSTARTYVRAPPVTVRHRCRRNPSMPWLSKKRIAYSAGKASAGPGAVDHNAALIGTTQCHRK